MAKVGFYRGSHVGGMTLDELSALRDDNIQRGSKFDLSVKCAVIDRAFIIKIMLGENVLIQEKAENQELHKALAEAHVKFSEFLNKKDAEFVDYMELSKPGWAARSLNNGT